MLQKSSRHDEVSAHTFLKIVSQMHQIAFQRIFISKTIAGGVSPDPTRKFLAFGHSGLLPQTINPR